ncbi:hypothetical protein ACFQGT_03435 [Natrialbaceae archaeon GCM10025810]|uniref:hypothetical protein n=1 Tax=Halovalidus salilacus TaxID=3075124 RepID=UPI0036131D86
MTETVDLQGEVIGLGTLAAMAVLLYGTFVSTEIAGVAAVDVATVIFAGTFVVVAALHAWIGQYNLAWGHGGAGAGLLFVLLGESLQRVAIGLLLLFLSGAYIALVVRRLHREAEAAAAGVDA